MTHLRKTPSLLVIPLLLAACAAPAAAPGAAPVEVTRIVEVTREVEVTRIVEATPAPSGAAAPTPAPAAGVPSGYGKTLEAIKARGKLICGVNSQVPGFGFVDSAGNFSGFDIDFCKALAAAIFNREQGRVSPADRRAAFRGPAERRDRRAHPQHHLDADARHRQRRQLRRYHVL